MVWFCHFYCLAAKIQPHLHIFSRSAKKKKSCKRHARLHNNLHAQCFIWTCLVFIFLLSVCTLPVKYNVLYPSLLRAEVSMTSSHDSTIWFCLFTYHQMCHCSLEKYISPSGFQVTKCSPTCLVIFSAG